MVVHLPLWKTRAIIIINILFVPHYKTKQNHKLLINLESAVYRLKCRKIEKVGWELLNGSGSSSTLYTSGIQQNNNVAFREKITAVKCNKTLA